MSLIYANNLYQRTAANKTCTAFGVRLVPSPVIAQLARQAGFDSLFIELEHSNLSLLDSSNLCWAALACGITPFVRVPHQCGNGFVQRVLDGGAMGIIFPHIHGREDAEAAVAIAKYPPAGKRSMTSQLPQFRAEAVPVPAVIENGNRDGSAVLLMIETKDSIDRVDEIASVPGVDVLLVGSNDLCIELGVPGDLDSGEYRDALQTVSAACRRHGKIFGLAGVYDNPQIQGWAMNDLGARYILGQQDSSWIASGSKTCLERLRACSSTVQ